jgi:tetratricopeptide (TPR) repeat protein
VEAYTSLLRYGIEDARLEYNLANTEFRRGNLGEAILHYERARRIDPTDPDIAANLELARSMCVDRVEEPSPPVVLRWIVALQDRLGPDRQSWIIVGAVWLLALLIAGCSARPGGWSALTGWIAAALLIALFLITISWYVTYQRLEGEPLAVVLAKSTEVLAGPGDNNPALTTVHEGLTLAVRTHRDEWVQVSLPNGLTGWVRRSALGAIGW